MYNRNVTIVLLSVVECVIMTKDEIKRLQDSITINGTVNLNLDFSPKKCRILWHKLVTVNFWIEKYASKVTAIEIPTVGYDTGNEENIFSNFSTLQSLRLCSLCGGRHGENGEKLKGTLVDLPLEPVFSTTLISLDLSFNCIKHIPASLKHLYNLKTLMLSYNDIEILSFESAQLKSLEELYVRNNAVAIIDDSLLQLENLKVLVLSSNKVTNLPDIFHLLLCLVHLDISNNKLKQLPLCIFQSRSVKKLVAGHNQITNLSLDSVKSSFDIIDVRYNFIAIDFDEIKQDPRILLEGNNSIMNTNSDLQFSDYDVEIKSLDSDLAEINVNSRKGAGFLLPSGIQITIPNNFSSYVDSIYCNVISKEPTDFRLNPTDQLLSVILELTPNGSRFCKPFRISIPFECNRCDQQTREIVLRVTTISNRGKVEFEDLKSETNITHEDEDSKCFTGEVTAYVNHFSIFGVVSRLVEDNIVVHQNAPATVFSTVNNINRLHFPMSSVVSPTNITVTLLTVGQKEVQSVVDADFSPVSDVLHVIVSPRETVFCSPITVHLALPNQLVGRPYDQENLRLIKCSENSFDWHDITDNVDLLKYTTVDVSFQVNSFSKFWLVWRNVMGVARKVYQRVITYKVQFIAMQKKALPIVVYAQCIREDLVQNRIQQLIEDGYFGKDAYTVVQELMEGDRFRIKVMGDLKLKSYNDADKKHLEEKVLVRRFHSQYPPEKSSFCKFCVEPLTEGVSNVSGYISFYKLVESFSGELEESDQSLPKNPHYSQCHNSDQQPLFSIDLEYLDDVLITVEKSETTLHLQEGIEHPLKYGELGTGMFKESNLRYIASQIGAEWEEVGHYLGIRTDDMDRIKLDNPGQTRQQIFCMLKKWSVLHMHEENCIMDFTNALKDAERADLAEKVEKIYSEGVEKFKCTIKRSRGLNQPQEFSI